MSESGTKKGRRLACANDSAGGPNGLKAMWKWRKEGRELPPPRGPLLQLSSPSSLFLLTGTAKTSIPVVTVWLRNVRMDLNKEHPKPKTENEPPSGG